MEITEENKQQLLRLLSLVNEGAAVVQMAILSPFDEGCTHKYHACARSIYDLVFKRVQDVIAFVEKE